jgi:hypothetical protein
MIKIKPIRKLIRIIKKSYNIVRFKKIALCQIEDIKNLPQSPYSKQPNDGYQRGMDYYEESEFVRILTLTMVQFQKTQGRFPDLVAPKGFNEKILWTKFFGEIKTPESGNKLLTSRFIPEDIKKDIQCPEIHWRSTAPRLPGNHEIKPGEYYIKATHGSGMFKRVRYPMTERTLASLEKKCKKWLATPYGIEKGEWWYNVFDREIIIDEDVSGDARSIAFDFFVFHGNVEHITLHKKGDSKNGELDELTRLDSDFCALPDALQSFRPRVEIPDLSEDTKQRMKYYASRIGENAPFVRVDFVLGKDEKIYLIEVTFSPANGLAKRPVELDTWLGSKWIL